MNDAGLAIASASGNGWRTFMEVIGLALDLTVRRRPICSNAGETRGASRRSEGFAARWRAAAACDEAQSLEIGAIFALSLVRGCVLRRA